MTPDGPVLVTGASGFVGRRLTAALLIGPWRAGLDPSGHVYPATVWLLLIWAALHLVIGVIMQLYCVARRRAGHLTARHDLDLTIVALYWHFCLFMVALSALVVVGFPLAIRAGAG